MLRRYLRFLCALIAVLGLAPIASLLPATPSLASTAAPAPVATPLSVLTPEHKLKLTVLQRLTNDSAEGREVWRQARDHRAEWGSYHFNWATDFCSFGSNRPFGFNFRMACARHDFGYRNFRELGLVQYKPALDAMLYHDLRAVCHKYGSWRYSTCTSVAWTYYQAVQTFGTLDDASEPEVAAFPVRLCSFS